MKLLNLTSTFPPIESIRVLVAPNFDGIPFWKRKLLIACIWIWRHRRRVVVEKSYEPSGPFLSGRWIVLSSSLIRQRTLNSPLVPCMDWPPRPLYCCCWPAIVATFRPRRSPMLAALALLVVLLLLLLVCSLLHLLVLVSLSVVLLLPLLTPLQKFVFG